MKTTKLVMGIVSFLFSIIILFQSCVAGIGSALENNKNDTSGSAGVMVGLLLIIAGIVAIAARKSKGGAVAATIIYALAGIIGIASNGIFKDLLVWGIISLIFAAFFVLSIFKQDYSNSEDK